MREVRRASPTSRRRAVSVAVIGLLLLLWSYSAAHTQDLPPPPSSADAAAFNPEVSALPPSPTIETDRLDDLEQRYAELRERLNAATSTKPAFPTAKITGFTQFDAAWYGQTRENIDTVGDAQDGAGFRRARLAVQGKAAAATAYQLEVDFATGGRPSFFDTYVEQSELPFVGNVRVGQFLQPFSVDAMSGFRQLPFLERSLPFLAFVPFRRIGVMAWDSMPDEMGTWGCSVFRTGGFNNAPVGDSRFATDIGDVGGYSFSTRLTRLLQYEGDPNLWQVGAGYNFGALAANDAIGSGTNGNAGSPRPFYQARTTPEFGPLGYSDLSSAFGMAVNSTPIFVDTGRYEANNFSLVGVETVYQNGPLSIQSEWMGVLVNSVAGPVYYHGAYGEVMYRLTGEHRAFNKQLGVLQNAVPRHDFISFNGERRGIVGWGAWEVAVRYSYVDLRNPDNLDGHYYDSATNTFTGSSHPGTGLLQDVTLGVTWFLNAHTKLQCNWIHAMLNNSAMGHSTAELAVLRVQADY